MNPEYRDSHASPNYGQHYERTYLEGYYRHQWELIERPLLQDVLTKLRSNGNEKILDFACGTGRITEVIETIFPDVTGVDVSETMLAQAREKCRKANFIQQDITKSSLVDTFDAVTSFRFFLNAQPELRADALRAIGDCLNDDGRLIFNIHVNSSSALGFAYRIRNRIKGQTIAKTCSYSEIEVCLRESGFEVQESIWYSYLPRVGWRFSGLSRRLMLPVEKFSRWFPLVPKKLAQSFLIVAKKSTANQVPGAKTDH